MVRLRNSVIAPRFNKKAQSKQGPTAMHAGKAADFEAVWPSIQDKCVKAAVRTLLLRASSPAP